MGIESPDGVGTKVPAWSHGHLSHDLTGVAGTPRSMGWRPVPRRTYGSVVTRGRGAHSPCMTKRIVAAFLWFYTGWYAGAMLAEILSVSPALGPILGAAAAGLIVGDPRGMIWKRQAIRPTAPKTRPTAGTLPEAA